MAGMSLPSTTIQQLLAALGAGADPAAGRPGVSVSAPGSRNVPGSGAVSPRGRQFVPTGPQPGAVQPNKARPGSATPQAIQRATPTTAQQSPASQQAAAAANGDAAAAPVDSGLLASLGLGPGFKQGLGTGAAALAAGQGQKTFLGGFAKSLAAGMGHKEALAAAQAKQAREDAETARVQANADRSFNASERRADIADRRSAAADARATEDQDFQKQDRAREEEERNDPGRRYLDAKEKAVELTDKQIGKRSEGADPEEWQKAFEQNWEKSGRHHGAGYGMGTDRSPLVPRSSKKYGPEGTQEDVAAAKKGEIIRIDTKDGPKLVRKLGDGPDGGIEYYTPPPAEIAPKEEEGGATWYNPLTWLG